MLNTTRFLVTAALASSCFSVAHAQSAGTVDATAGSPGGVLVTRDGESYSILSGDPVFAGDVVSTTADTTASVTAYGCTIDLAVNSSVTLDEAFCEPGAVTTVSNQSSDPVGDNGSAMILGGAGLAALVGLAAGGGGGGGGGSSPVSP